MTENQPVPDGTDLNDLMAGQWNPSPLDNRPEAAAPAETDEPDDEPKEMEDLHSLGVTEEQMAAIFPPRKLSL